VGDRGKISFSELDRIRRGKRRGGDGTRRGEQAQRKSRSAVNRYKRKVEERLFGKGENAARLRHEERLRESHGSPQFRSTCKDYFRTQGFPRDPGLLVLMLDLEEERDVLGVMEAIEGVIEEAAPEQKSLLRSRLRNLEMSASSDAVADAAADLAARL
jgi:hypothetical protein